MSERFNWTDFPEGTFDIDEPITITKGRAILNDLKALCDAMWSYDGVLRLYGGPNPHSHDGTNSAVLGVPVTESMLAAGCVTTDKIKDGAIEDSDIANTIGMTQINNTVCANTYREAQNADGVWHRTSHGYDSCPE